MKKNKQLEYTKKRERDHIKNMIRDDKKLNEELIKMHNRTMHRVNREIEAFVGRYATEKGLTYSEAMKKISKVDAEAFVEKAKEYVKRKDFSDKANKELRLYNLKMRVSRLELLKRETNLALIDLANAEETKIRDWLTDQALNELKRQSTILGMTIKDRRQLAKDVEKIVNADFHSAKFSDRIWANQEWLQSKLSRGIERSILSGEHPRKWSRTLKRNIKKEFKSAASASTRIAVTEVSRVQAEIQKEAREEAGYEKYIYVAEPTACEICAALDGEIFNNKEARIGENHFPMHPWCKCSAAAYEMDKTSEKGYNIDEIINDLELKNSTYSDIVKLGEIVNQEHEIDKYVGDKENLKKIFSKYRDIGGKVEKEYWAKGASKVVKEKLENAFSFFPSDWANIPKKHERQLYVRKGKRGFFVEGAVKSNGIMYDSTLNGFKDKYLTIVTDGFRDSTAFHEIGHLIEWSNPEVLRIEKEFIAKRTKNEKATKLKDIFPGWGYREDEFTKRDNFISPYIGKEYDDATEVLSMGLEALFEPGRGVIHNYDVQKRERTYRYITDDKEYLNLIIGLILKG